MNNPPMSVQESIDLSLLIERTGRAVDKSDTSKPDSIGDKLFRTYLNLKFARNKGDFEKCKELGIKANELIELADNEKI